MNEEIAKIIPPIPNQSWLRVLYKLLLLEFIHVLIKIVHTYTKLYIYMYTFKTKQKTTAKTYTKIEIMRFQIVLLALGLMIQY